MSNNLVKENRIGRGRAIVCCGTRDSRLVATQIRILPDVPKSSGRRASIISPVLDVVGECNHCQ